MKWLLIKLSTIPTVFAGDTGGSAPPGSTGSTKSIDQILQSLISNAQMISLWVGIIMVIIGGYFILTAGANEQNVELGRKTITYAVVGIIIIFLAGAIISIVKKIV